MRKRLALQFMIPTAIVVIVGVSALGLVVNHYLESEVRRQADKEAADQVQAMFDVLNAANDLSSQSVRSAMKVLRQEGGRSGVPNIAGSVKLGENAVPGLRLGTASEVGNFELVDHVKQLMGTTATLFVKQNDQFVRVSTNVLKPDGSRAIGTNLDPKGPAYAAVRTAQPFYGVVDVLGKPYMTGYEPMLDSSNQTVGIWYVGIPLNAVASLEERVVKRSILDHGFIVLLHDDGRVIFKSEAATEDQIKTLNQHPPADWVVHRQPFSQWGYTLLAAYPNRDVAARLRGMQLIAAFCIVVMSSLVVLAQYLLITRVVLKPVHRLIDSMRNADLNTALVDDRQDEIGLLAQSFDSFVASIRETLLEVNRATERVASAVGELTTTSEHITANSNETSSQANLVSSSSEEVHRNLQTVSAGAEQMSSSIKEIAKTAHESATIASGAVKVAEQTTEIVSKLGDASTEIGQVTKVITSIAEQTNLLALNATIEAARAGEAGKGFAVVANEVKELAKQTAHATEEIRCKIEAIQSTTTKAVAAIGQIGDVIRQIDSYSNTIAAAVEEQNATTNEMTRSVGEAAHGASEINRNISGVAGAAQNTAQRAAESAQAAESLAEMSKKLGALISRFHVESHSSSNAPRHPASALTAHA